MNEALKFAIIRSRKTQREVARLANIHDTTLSNIILGYRKATKDQQQALAQVLQKSRRALFPKEKTDSEPTEATA